MKKILAYACLTYLILALFQITGCGDGPNSGGDDLYGSDRDTNRTDGSDPEDSSAPLDTGRVGDTDFVSANPSQTYYSDADADGDTDVDGDVDGEGDVDSAETNDADDTDSGETEREIEEADILHVVDNTLYALSRYRGLTVIDISTPAKMRILGRFQAYGVPFEMYIRDNVVMALYSSFYSYEYNDETGQMESGSNSRVLALDVSNPAQITELGAFELLGAMSDSRIVGDVLYTVSFEDGYCRGCDATRKSVITSLDMANLTTIHVVDSLAFEEENYSWRRSIAVNQNRMYVSGPGYTADDWDGYRSTLQVVDISDPGGDLVEGASVELAGQIESRWQMNEYNGVLRIISQPGSTWGSGEQPVVETFEVVSSQELKPLGQMKMTLPTPENLMSVRFDGDRAYAVTFERTDPLFVIDISDPTQPVQLGELEIPGWLYHMEPRGDRLFAIGFDDSSDVAGGMAVSLFDVANPTEPVMLDRVNFGSQWGWMPEDQDRIHKAFRILDDLGLILMPFSGWSTTDDGYYGQYHSGIQLIDFTNDTLTLRGVAPHKGHARRAFVHDDTLFAMSDERVDAFSIDDRDNPQKLSSVTLSRTVYRTVRAGDYVVELISDWWTKEAGLEIYPIDAPDGDIPVGTIDLSGLRPENAYEYYYWYSSFNFSNAALYQNGNYIYLMWSEYPSYIEYDMAYEEDYQEPQEKLGVAIFDISDATQPKMVNKQMLPMLFNPGRYNSYWYSRALPGVGNAMVQKGAVFASKVNRYDWYYNEDGDYVDKSKKQIAVLDLSSPSNIQYATIEQDSYQNEQGFQDGDGVLYSSHSEAVDDEAKSVKFYLDRLDISNPEAPKWLPPINVPGTPVYYSERTGKLVTIDYRWVFTTAKDDAECGKNYYYYYGVIYDEETKECAKLHYRLALLQVDDIRAAMVQELSLGQLSALGRVVATDEALFLNLPLQYIWHNDYEDYEVELPRLLAWSLNDATPFKELGNWTVPATYVYLQDVKGTRALMSTDYPPAALLYDAAVGGEDALTQEMLRGYGYDMTLESDFIISANGMWGVQTIKL
ncbi:MAG: beta-propeller domain-containing protein [Deltaproteobacteria bacterium]|nr:beta-propeller domain-containing protein [Deltaproteobacteria bacterium]